MVVVASLAVALLQHVVAAVAHVLAVVDMNVVVRNNKGAFNQSLARVLETPERNT